MAKSLLRSTSIVSLMTFISRILGFVRDMLAAQLFGVNASADAFLIAFKIPNFMRNMFAEGSFSQAFVPALSEFRQTKSPDEVKTFINHIAGCLCFVLAIVTLIGFIFTPVFVSVFSTGLDPLRFHYACGMLRITFSYIFFISLTAFSGAILNNYGYFAIPSFTPALLNIVLIITAIFLSPHLTIPVESQAWGVLIAGIVQLVFQLPFLAKLGLLPIPMLNWKDPGVRKVLKLMVPALFGASITQLSLLFNTIFASFLTTGSFVWLYNSERLAYFSLGVFGVALATVVLPHLSRKHAENSIEQFQKTLDWGIRCNLLIGLPSMTGLLCFAGPIITTLFQYGKYKPFDVLMTQQCVIAYAIGIQAFMLIKLLSSSFYARQDIKTPVRVGIVSMLCNIALNALLIVPMKHSGLALATSLAAWLNAGILGFLLWKKNIYQFQRGWLKFFAMILCANVVMAIILIIGKGHLDLWFIHKWQWRFFHLSIWLFLAVLSYIITLYSFGFRLRFLRGI